MKLPKNEGDSQSRAEPYPTGKGNELIDDAGRHMGSTLDERLAQHVECDRSFVCIDQLRGHVYGACFEFTAYLVD